MTDQTADTTVAEKAAQVIEITASIKEWFALAVPEPTDRNKTVQLGVHFEEVAEMFDALSGISLTEMTRLADRFKANEAYAHLSVISLDAEQKALLLDSLCDQIVTAIGVAHMFGFNILGALAEVNDSNYSKFKDGKPLFNDDGKIVKNLETYRAPDLTPFI